MAIVVFGPHWLSLQGQKKNYKYFFVFSLRKNGWVNYNIISFWVNYPFKAPQFDRKYVFVLMKERMLYF